MLHSLYRSPISASCPSIYEPFGIVALEAMASGCLCVVADTGGLREVVPGDGTVGLRFPSRDTAALHEIVERVLADDALRAQLVAEAREHVLRFDWAQVARETLRALRARAGGRGPRPPDPAVMIHVMRYSVVNIDEIEGTGPGGAVRFVRREFGVEAFGINWFELPPDADGFEHDERRPGRRRSWSSSPAPAAGGSATRTCR